LIEDEEQEALEVDFANKYLGGGALSRGCVQVSFFLLIDYVLNVKIKYINVSFFCGSLIHGVSHLWYRKRSVS
jgi:poly(ADP-ribose) glycohydrolase